MVLFLEKSLKKPKMIFSTFIREITQHVIMQNLTSLLDQIKLKLFLQKK